ncbi:selenocysteine-specific translation elongation factor [Aquisalimonas sp.]|uniref:selenocysteine-specific translation elongation factor n=1 Tax=Aquisalimonas sp. TaxID=1872621 RepID=UPI0025C50798|nr:selenocysteine-specific translation elongation factor [Aquisalimonas sp.]
MIIATAGHVDHGKTSLVKALTGVDTDRLEEEKRRSLTIEPGFAYVQAGSDQLLGFVDVPGHARFIRNMLAGISVLDFALLVVAADDGPMPQTAEHVAILELLGLQQGAVAITKIDRVAPGRVGAVADEVATLLAGGRLREAPVFSVAPPIGRGIAALRDHLLTISRTLAAHPANGYFRMAVDRSFTLSGVGRVVTGAVSAGTTQVGDQLVISPQGISVRIRGIHSNGQRSESARAGMRCALNITASDTRHAEAGRGDWLVAGPAHAPTAMFDTRLQVLATEQRPLCHWAPVRLHIGAAAVNARAVPLEGRHIEPGAMGLAQLVLDCPINAVHGDRFVLRDPSAQRTVAGGLVVDPFAVKRGRSKPERRARLSAMSGSTPRGALSALLAIDSAGVNLDCFTRAYNLTQEEAQTLYQALPMQRIVHGEGAIGLTPGHWQALRERVRAALHDQHAQHPASLGLSEAALVTRLGEMDAPPAIRAAIRSMLAQGEAVRDGFSLRLPDHQPRLSTSDAALLEAVCEVLRCANLRPPVVGKLAESLEMEQIALRESLERFAHLGYLVRVAPNRFFLPETLAALARIAAELAAESLEGTFDAAAYRDRSGIGRNVTIQVLEFLDRAGITRFAGDRRSMAPGAVAYHGGAGTV